MHSMYSCARTHTHTNIYKTHMNTQKTEFPSEDGSPSVIGLDQWWPNVSLLARYGFYSHFFSCFLCILQQTGCARHYFSHGRHLSQQEIRRIPRSQRGRGILSQDLIYTVLAHFILMKTIAISNTHWLLWNSSFKDF